MRRILDESLLKEVKVLATLMICKSELLKEYYVFISILNYGINGLISTDNINELLTTREVRQFWIDGKISFLIRDEWVETVLKWLVESWRI